MMKLITFNLSRTAERRLGLPAGRQGSVDPNDFVFDKNVF